MGDEANHRRTEKWYSTDNALVETLTFTYDVAGNLTGAAHSAGVYTVAYDPANRPDVVQGLFGLTMTFFSVGSDEARLPIGSFSESPVIGRH